MGTRAVASGSSLAAARVSRELQHTEQSLNSDQLKRVRLRRPPLRNSSLWSEGRESTRLPAVQTPRSSVLRLGLMRTLGLARIWLCRRPHRDTEAGHVFLMESNPRGLYFFSFNLGHLFLFLRI